MSEATIVIPPGLREDVWTHLLPPNQEVEHAAFLFVRPVEGVRLMFHTVEWYAVPAAGYSFSSAYHFELASETLGAVIKRAHDLGTSLVEVHSHLDDEPPSFSPSDLYGFKEFVPHVWWRLHGRPYFALVVSTGGIDGLAWIEAADAPERIADLRSGGLAIKPSRKSCLRWTSRMRGYSHE